MHKRIFTVFKGWLLGWLCIIVFAIFESCEPPPRYGNQAGKVTGGVDKFITSNEVSSTEEYVMVTTAINLPLYVNHDQKAFLKWGEKMGVRTSILGPSEWDVPGQIATIEQVIPRIPIHATFPFPPISMAILSPCKRPISYQSLPINECLFELGISES